MRYRIILICVLLFILNSAGPQKRAEAALWQFHSVHNSVITLCFVGDAVTVRADRVNQILEYLQEFEYAANIRFDYLGECPAPTPHPSDANRDYFAGDIRVIIPNSNVNHEAPIVQGNGCPKDEHWYDKDGKYNGGNDGWGSWANPPSDLEVRRSCLYNIKLGDDPWDDTPYLNHTLHEFGHALGLSHEHERLDATCYNPAKDKRWTDQGYMTPYDRDSVMHYKFTKAAGHTCDVDGNYGYAGLSTWDKLALHILYPEENRAAEFLGRRVVQSGEQIVLRSAWKARGANLDFVASNFVWRLNGQVVGTAPDLVINAPAVGSYTLTYSYRDFLGREYSYSGPLVVLSPDAYQRRISAALSAATEALFAAAEDDTVSVPVTGGSYTLASNVTIAIDSNVFSRDVVLDYAVRRSNNISGFHSVGVAYELAAIDALSGETVQPRRSQRYEIQLTYDPSRLPAGAKESDLALYSYQNDNWEREPSSVVDMRTHQITASPSHFSRWAILAPATQGTEEHIYLPIVQR